MSSFRGDSPSMNPINSSFMEERGEHSSSSNSTSYELIGCVMSCDLHVTWM